MPSPAVSANGTAYFGTSRRVYALNGLTGEVVWEVQTGEPMTDPVIGPDGTVYVISTDDSYQKNDFQGVCAIDGVTGQVRWRHSSEGAHVRYSPTVAADGTVYVGAYKGKVLAIDGKTGERKREIETQFSTMAPVALGLSGDLYLQTADGAGREFLALKGTAGLAASPWPKSRGGLGANLGSVEQPGPPILHQTHRARFVARGETTELAVLVGGQCPMSFRWFRDGRLLEGETENRPKVENFQEANVGAYQVVASNARGEVKSPVMEVGLGVPVDIQVEGPGRVTLEPAGGVYPIGHSHAPSLAEGSGRVRRLDRRPQWD